MPMLQLGDDCYRIVGDGMEGPTARYGEQATLDNDELHLTALVGVAEDGELAGMLPGGVKVVNAITREEVQCEEEEVEFEFEGADDGGDEDDELDDEEDDEDLDGDEDKDEEEEEESSLDDGGGLEAEEEAIGMDGAD